MPGVQREGDRNTLGGICMGGDSSVLVNGKPIAIPNMRVTPHYPCGVPKCPPCEKHCNATTKHAGEGQVLVNGKPVIIDGDTDTCNCTRTGGSPDVKIG